MTEDVTDGAFPPDTVETTTCAVVGRGPAGMVLSYLLARQGISVTLLESHPDFNREMRGDTFPSSSMQLMADLGLSDRAEALANARLRVFSIIAETGRLDWIDPGRARTPFPYIALIPQARFLDLMAPEASRLPSFRLVMGATATELMERVGRIRGVLYRCGRRRVELHADLTVAADGRGSRLRRPAGLAFRSVAPPMDVLWFEVPREPATTISFRTWASGSGPGRCWPWRIAEIFGRSVTSS